jgi:N-acetylglucosaminyldiphosphoundecaprenol N-acetyl-beta-D-mannosaminyltransferase
MTSNRVVQIDTIPIDDIGFEETVSRIIGWADEGSGGYVCTVNVDYVVRARRDHRFRSAVLEARLRVPDGMGIIYGSKLAGQPLHRTVTGRLLPTTLAADERASAIPTALVGGLPGAAERAAARLRNAGANMVAAVEPPMGFAIGSAEDRELVASLRAHAPRVVFVGLGSPKQDLWMRQHASELPEAVLIGIGAGIDVLAGAQPAAPRWMTRIGLEWAFRLAHDPRRLARRYLWDDPRFFWWMTRAGLWDR